MHLVYILLLCSAYLKEEDEEQEEVKEEAETN